MKLRIIVLLTNIFLFIAYANAAVTITFSSPQATYLINPPNVSGVANDPLDPAATIGVKLDVKENGIDILAANYSVAATSSKSSVVAVSNIIVTKYDGYCIVKITPSGVGYSNIKLTLTKGSSMANVTVAYAASAASATPANTKFNTGISDASAAIALDTNYMLIGDDEINSLFVYDRKKSGLPIKTFDYQNLLGLTDGSTGNYKEVDLEAATKSPNIANRIYWISSFGTAGSSNVVKANINRLFATNVTGTGLNTSISVVGYYSNLRNQLINWGDSKGYNFTASAAAGHDSKTIDGFNVEGLCFAPNNTDLWVAFRAPLVPVSNRTNAVIAPITNFETWFNNGSPSGNPTMGNAIELNLGGRGIRDIIRLSNGVYVIVAGNYDSAPLTGALFKWTGNATDAPILLTDFNIANLNAEAAVEVVENNILAENKIEIISDNGSYDFYGDGTQAKDLTENNYKKYRSDLLIAANNVLPNETIDFTAVAKNNVVNIYWKNNMQNIAEVVVEKANNNKDFIAIYSSNAMLNSGIFADENLSTQTTSYRLKLITLQGKIIYSNIIVVSVKNNVALQIYPNPASNILQINTNSNAFKTVEITNENGNVVAKYKFNEPNKTLNVQYLANGSYILTVIINNQIFTHKVLIHK